MPKSENQKLKIIYIKEFFEKYCDENHPTNATDIIDFLKDEYGIEAERRSVYRDIDLLRDVYLMDIENERGGKYRLLSQKFEMEDLRLLAECVHSAKFISKSKAKELVKTIAEFGSVYQAEQLQEEVFLCDRVKTTRKGIMANISQINFAMARKIEGKPRTPSKISFKYLKYFIEDVRKPIEQFNGMRYVVSPYKLLINEGNYYLLAYNDYSKAMRTYRVDRMKSIEILEGEPREGADAYKEIDMETYTERVINMFSGEKRRVKMRFSNDLLDTVIERFGTEHLTHYEADGKHHFTISTNVDISDQFYGWLCGFRNKVTIIEPEDVCDDMRKYLSEILEMYETE